MKIVGIEEFLNLPNGTIFQRYTPHTFNGDLEVFNGRVCSDRYGIYDFYYTSISNEVDSGDDGVFDQLVESEENGKDFKFDYNCGRRDGHCSDADSLFAIYDKNDVRELINTLTNLLQQYK